MAAFGRRYLTLLVALALLRSQAAGLRSMQHSRAMRANSLRSVREGTEEPHQKSGRLEMVSGCATVWFMSRTSLPQNPLQRTLTGPGLTRLAGCSADTFRTWRNRNGLFPERSGDYSWKKFNFAEVCAVRAVLLMTGSGILANDACLYTNSSLLPEIELIVQAKSRVRFVAILRNPSEHGWFKGSQAGEIVFTSSTSNSAVEYMFKKYPADAALEEVLRASGGVAIVIDIQHIIDQVAARYEAEAN